MKTLIHLFVSAIQYLCIMGLIFISSTGILAAPAASTGTDITVMLDMSMGANSQDPIVRTLSAGARVAAAELKPGDRVSLVEFSGNAKTILPLTEDIRKWESALRHAGNWVVEREQRRLHDSLLTVLSAFPNRIEPDRRKCIVVLTMATDTGSHYTAKEVVSAAKAKGIVIFVALLVPSRDTSRRVRGAGTQPNGPSENTDEVKRLLESAAIPTGGIVRVYEANQYAIAQAIRGVESK